MYKAIRKDFNIEITVRKMEKGEMPDDGIEYYHDEETGNIYKEEELKLLSGN